MAWLFIIFIVGLPLFELWLLITIGAQIGGLAVIVLSLATAAAGIAIAKQQGLLVLQELQIKSRLGEPISAELAHGAMLLLAGLVLLFPGFLTDAAGALLLLPAVRRILIRHFARGRGSHWARRTIIIEGEIVQEDENSDKHPIKRD